MKQFTKATTAICAVALLLAAAACQTTWSKGSASKSIRRSSFGKTKEGKSVIIEATGLASRIFQHELDHLQGKLIIDRITPLKRWKIRKELEEIKKKGKVQ